MNSQTIFNRVVKHLLTQNKKSEKDVHCLYRGPAGLKCAIGCLILDKYYRKDLEERGVEAKEVRDVLEKLGVMDISLCEELQSIHDDLSVSEWPDALYELATDLEIKIPPILRKALLGEALK